METQEKSGFLAFIKRNLVSIVCWAALIAVFWTGINSAEESSRTEGLKIVSESIKKAAVTCYSLEGMYPQNLQYLIDNYNLQINTDLYTVHYEIFASNLMPDITVTIKQGVEH